MKKQAVILIIFSLFASVVWAKKAPQNLNLKYWTDGKLTWEDFQDSTEIKGLSSTLKVRLEIDIKPEKTGNVKTIRPKAISSIDRSKSWVDTTRRTDGLLRYNQAVFDLLEVYRRKLQQELNAGISMMDATHIYHNYTQYYTQQSETMRFETAEGLNTRKMEEWETYILKELNRIQPPPPPTIQPRAFGYGINIGFGTTIPTADIHDRFGASPMFCLGFDFAYKDLHFLFDMGVGSAKNRMDMFINSKKGDAIWEKGRHTNYSFGSITAGYDVFENDHIKLTPFVGYGFTEYSKIKGEKENEKYSINISDPNITAGVSVDYKFLSVISLIPSFWLGHREITTSSIRTRLFVTYANYDYNVKGYLIGLSVSYSVSGRMLKLK